MLPSGYVDTAGLELLVFCFHFPAADMTGVCHHISQGNSFFEVFFIYFIYIYIGVLPAGTSV